MDEATAEIAKDEAARQAIILAFSIVGVVVMVWAQRHAADPDAGKTARMQAAKGAERWFARLAAWSWHKAESARLRYEQDRA